MGVSWWRVALVAVVVAAVALGATWVVHGVATYTPTPDERFMQVATSTAGFSEGTGLDERRDQAIADGHFVCANPELGLGLQESDIQDQGASPAQAAAIVTAARQVYCP